MEFRNIRTDTLINGEEQKDQKEDRFLRGRQIADLIYEYFRQTGEAQRREPEGWGTDGWEAQKFALFVLSVTIFLFFLLQSGGNESLK